MDTLYGRSDAEQCLKKLLGLRTHSSYVHARGIFWLGTTGH